MRCKRHGLPVLVLRLSLYLTLALMLLSFARASNLSLPMPLCFAFPSPSSTPADVRSWAEGIQQDLAVLDITRGRDAGLPTYVQTRAQLGLAPPRSWSDVSSDVRVQLALGELYVANVSALELYVGLLAEAGASGSFLGPTAQAIIRDQFTRLRDGDSLWYEASGVLTAAELAEVKATRLADVIARNTDWVAPPASLLVAGGVIPSATATATGSPAATAPTNAAAASGTAAATASSSASAPAAAASSSPSAAAAAASPAAAGSGKRTATLNAYLSFEWVPPAAGETSITIKFTFQGTGWWGIGLGSASMAGADIWMMRYVNGRGEVVDTMSTSYAMPTADAHQDVTVVSSSQANGVTSITVRRALNTGDANDAVISSGTIPVVFAWDTGSTAYGYHGANKASAAVDFLKPAAGSGGNGTSNSTDDGGLAIADLDSAAAAAMMSQFGVHGLTQAFAWLGLVPAGVFAIRFLKHKPAHMVFHKFSMVTVGEWLPVLYYPATASFQPLCCLSTRCLPALLSTSYRVCYQCASAFCPSSTFVAATITLPAAGAALVSSRQGLHLAHLWVGMMLAGLIAAQVVIGVGESAR